MEQTKEIQQIQLQEITRNQGKHPLAPFLPSDLVMQIKSPMLKAEIAQSTLKHCDDQQISVFIAKVLNFINPKFDDVETEMQLAEAELYSFAHKCELTTDEFMIALEMAVDGKLYTEPDENGHSKRIQLFREIDRLKLGEVKAAYLYHKKIDKQYEIGKSIIKAFLEPPQKELTPEEKKTERINFYKTEFERLQKGEMVLGTTIFYELIKQAGLERISLKYVESVLDKFQPETFQSGLSVSKVGAQLDIPKKVTHNAKVFFIGEIVKSYFKKHNLKELTQDQFIDYWENIKNNGAS